MKIILMFLIFMTMSSFAQDKKNVRYEYKKFEKFDFERVQT